MAKYALFLRAVNVGGTATIDMARLRQALIEGGFAAAKSYINSGNLAVESQLDPGAVGELARRVIKSEFGLDVELVVKTAPQLRLILEGDPYGPGEDDPSKRLVAMLSRLDPEVAGRLDRVLESILAQDSRITESCYAGEGLVYIYYGDGVGRSKLTNALLEKKLGAIATMRNWNTMGKMLDLIQDS